MNPIRILHVANHNFFKYGTSFYLTERKIQNGLVRNGHFSFEFSYREVARWENIFRTSKMGLKSMNRRLLEAIEIVRPEVILFGHCELVFPETFHNIRKRTPQTHLALWYADSYVFPKKYKQLSERAALVDTVFTTTGGDLLRSLKKPNNRVAFLPNIADPSIERYRNFEKSDLPLDFIYCGRDYNPERTERLRKLIAALADIRYEVWGCLEKPALTGQAYYDKLSQAAVSLNLSHREDIPFYTSSRLVQLTGCGLLTLCPRTPGMDILFGEDEIVYYQSDEDLIDKILYYIEHSDERRRVAEKGWSRAHTSYSPERVTQFMVETIFHQQYSQDYEWLSEVVI